MSARSISHFQLYQKAKIISRYTRSFDSDFLRPFLGATTADDWSFYIIYTLRSGDPVLTYATNLPEKTYLILNTQLGHQDNTRKTGMRLHEMIRSTWAAQVASRLTELRYVGIHQIEDDDARTAISNAFTSAISQGASPALSQVTVSGDRNSSVYWKDNPYIAVACGVAGDPAWVTAHLIRENADSCSPMHMFIEIGAGQPAQEQDSSTGDQDARIVGEMVVYSESFFE